MSILELAPQAGINPKWVAGTAGGEYHSSCPSCGGTDRFYIQPCRKMSNCLGSYSCRRCGIYGDTIQFARRFLNYSFQEAVEAAGAIITERPMVSFHKRCHEYRTVSLQPPSEKWSAKANDFVGQAHEQLLRQQDVLTFLASRGLPIDAVCRYKLGWSPKNLFIPRGSWGLSELLGSDGKERLLWIPRGLVIPSIEHSGKVMRLKIRRYDWKEGDEIPKYVAISGSMNGLIFIGSTKRSTMVVVESELDAYAINFVADDFALAVAVGGNTKNPDNLTDYLARNMKHLLICHDNDDAGVNMLVKWQKLYPYATAYPTPIGKDIGEALQKNFDIKEWLLKAKNV